MAKFKVISDGSIMGGAQVFAPDGTDISGHVRAVDFRARAGEIPTVLLEIFKPEIEINLPAESVDKQYVDGELIEDENIRDKTSLAHEYKLYEPAQLNG